MWMEQLKVELKIYLRQPMYLLFSLLMPVMSFALFGTMYRNYEYNGMNFFASYIPGFCVIILFASSVYNIGNQVVGDKEKGIYRRLAVTPVSLKRIMLVIVCKTFLLALLGFVLILLLAIFMFKISFPNFLLYCASYVLAIIYALILGFGAGMLTNHLNTYSAVMMVLFMPMFILSDTSIPLSILPEFLRKFSKFNPLYHMTNVLRIAWDVSFYQARAHSFWMSMLFLMVFMFLFMTLVIIKWKRIK